MIRKIAFVGNQGGRDVLAFYAGMAKPLIKCFEVDLRFSVWLDSERSLFPNFGLDDVSVSSFESYVKHMTPIEADDVERLVRDYREVNWSEVVAVERAFTDYSMLLGAAGDRRETIAYVQTLVVAIVRYLEEVMSGCEAIVCQTADTLFSLITVKVARHLGVRVFAIRPGTLLEPGKGGGFFANNEYLMCDRMLSAFSCRQNTELLPEERARTDALLAAIRGFGGLTAYHAATSKGKNRGRHALSPNIKNLLPYLIENSRRDKNVEYIKIDPLRKLRGNILRFARKKQSKNSYGFLSVADIPEKSVFYALHYQPEQSTLAQGVWYANQIALVEDISKSLPLGYTLIVKEHPWGRGNRPRWQYEHMSGFYNVVFCDAPSKEIVQNVQAVITVTGTVAMEALVFDKPSVVLGRNYFDFCDLLYRVNNIQELPEILAKILLDGHYHQQHDREERLHRFLMAYLDGLIPSFPLVDYAEDWASALADELGLFPVTAMNLENLE